MSLASLGYPLVDKICSQAIIPGLSKNALA
jgi:hypothetical protein